MQKRIPLLHNKAECFLSLTLVFFCYSFQLVSNFSLVVALITCFPTGVGAWFCFNLMCHTLLTPVGDLSPSEWRQGRIEWGKV